MSIRNKMLKINRKAHAQNFRVRCWKMTAEQAMLFCSEMGIDRQAYEAILIGCGKFLGIPIKITKCGF